MVAAHNEIIGRLGRGCACQVSVFSASGRVESGRRATDPSESELSQGLYSGLIGNGFVQCFFNLMKTDSMATESTEEHGSNQYPLESFPMFFRG